MDQLRKSRGIAKGKITRIVNKTAGTDPTTLREDDIPRLETLVDRLMGAWTDFCAVQDDIMRHEEADEDVEEDVYAENEDRFDDTKSRLALLLASLTTPLIAAPTAAAPTPRPAATAAGHGHLRLPKMDLPTFSGSYTEWTSFWDLFNASVDSNTALSDSQKLHYLKAAVKGDASKLLTSIIISDANYPIARGVLKTRYENTRAIVRAHVKAIHGYPPIKQESSHALRKLVETMQEHLLALSSQGIKVEEWDATLVFMISEKLDSESRKQWELHTPGDKLQTYKELRDFLDARSRALEATPSYTPSRGAEKDSARKQDSNEARRVHTYHSSNDSCPNCKESHRLFQCPKFQTLSVPDRRAFVQRSRLCFNCLQSGHSVKECQSKRTCRECDLRHHTLIHRPPYHPGEQTPGDPPVALSVRETGSLSQVLLATAMVPVRNKKGYTIPCRALLDGGSQVTFVSESCIQRLGLGRRKQRVVISGVGDLRSADSNVATTLTIVPPNADSVSVTALVLPKLTRALPNASVDTRQWTHIHNIKLADPGFATPGDIDIILGADVYDTLVLGNKIREVDNVFLRETVFGWVVSGPTNSSTSLHTAQSFHVVNEDTVLSRFWEIEDLPAAPKLSQEEVECERHFSKTTTRDSTGRFVVKMPFKPEAPPLRNSLRQAERRFKSLEQRLELRPELKQKYAEFIDEFIQLGHMEEIPPAELLKQDSQCFYLPHHCVFKETSTTTKLRVVFDGSARTESGPALNESLMIGPKIQDDLVKILLRFRFHRVALSADVAKMYRQVALDTADKDFHRLLWRTDSKALLRHLRMTRIIYGIASSSFHSIRALQEVANLEPDEVASPVIKRDFYVDDLLSGAPSVEDAIQLQDRLMQTLDKGGFPLRKWTSSHSELINRLPEELRESADSLLLQDEPHTIKALGIRWSPLPDTFAFVVASLQADTFTKRVLLADTARIFDPMGWLAPIVIRLKCFMQECWVLGISWDDPLPSSLCNAWLSWRNDFSNIEALALSRCILPASNPISIQLHVFSDASEVAYAAAIYSRIEDDQGNVSVSLLAAKTRVAPVKTISIPRLELCGAHLAARLYLVVVSALEKTSFSIDSVHAWTDSTVVLAWLSELPRKWTTFVANRVCQIQDALPPNIWKHVASRDNPADCASRGLPPSQLLTHKLWWQGPEWLSYPEDSWPSLPLPVQTELPERKAKCVTIYTALESTTFLFDFDRFSSVSRLKRVIAYCLRFAHNIRHPRDMRRGPLQVAELSRALQLAIKATQVEQFPREIKLLQENKPMPADNKLLSLTPFLDEDSGILKVGGRLSQSNLPSTLQHPSLLDKTGQLVRLLIRQAHLDTMHGGAQLTFSKLRQEFWILRARDLVRSEIHGCVRCARFTAKPVIPIMGDLPEERITPDKPFTNTGLDFGGPFLVKSGGPRSKTTEKAYLALFVCFATKAVHLELVSALSTEACLAALRRFVARRGLPTAIYSDNGTNFVGARNELAELQKLLDDEPTKRSLHNFASSAGINWVMIPPRSPHFGGLWEAGIKSAKYHLRRIVGNTLLNFEELTTIFSQIEAILNSRPLTALSSDPNDLQALTPGHFLVGGPLNALPEARAPKIDSAFSLIKRWKLVQALVQSFWARWQSEYLPTLQQRIKWKKERPNLTVGDLVLITEDNTPPLRWILGRILELYLGNDNVARVARVRTSTTTLTRPIAKLRLLPVYSPLPDC